MDRYETFIVGRIESAIKNAVDGVECHIDPVTLQCMIDLLKEKPQIVRCKDCEFLIHHPLFMDDGYCRKMRDEEGVGLKPDQDWFCASGKPRKTPVKEG